MERAGGGQERRERGRIGRRVGIRRGWGSGRNRRVTSATNVGAYERSAAWIAAGAMLLVALFVCLRLDAFDLWTTVETPELGSVRLVNTFASVDHPFHATRANTLLDSLRDGEILRWIGDHQGGYPVEFYPLGEAWLEVGVWALLLGSVPILAVHKLVVILIFLLPGLAYWLLAREDRASAAVPLAALLVHVAVPGGWVHGGSKELIVWGLGTNVAAATALLFVLWGLATFLSGGRWAIGSLAAVAASFALATNTRSAIGLAIVGIGCWLAAVERTPDRWRQISGRLMAVTALAAAMSAPILIPLIRFADLYYFVRYSRYESLEFYVDKILTSVSPPVAVLGLAGVAVGLFVADRPATRAAAISLAIYVVVTATFATDLRDSGLFEQLEATRLMPFQRYVTIYLAAVAADVALRWLLPRAQVVRDIAIAGSALVLFVVYVVPLGPVADDNHGLMEVGETPRPGSPMLVDTGTAAQAEFLSAVRIADERVPGEGAMLILGTDLSWHQQLWAPTETDRPLFYNDFLWYWHRLHEGPYNYRQGNAYPARNVGQTLEDDYLTEHGIEVVLVTSDAFKDEAAVAPTLELVASGLYDVYRVRDPAPIVRFGGGVTQSLDVSNGEIRASGASTGGTAKIARNWYPRWKAEVNGEPVPITRTDDGYMSVPIPAGQVELKLAYGVDRWDWLGRVLMVLGVLATAGISTFGVIKGRLVAVTILERRHPS
jgi:hypothetical protein